MTNSICSTQPPLCLAGQQCSRAAAAVPGANTTLAPCSHAAVAAYHTLFAMQQLPAILPALAVLPIEPFQLTSFALSLLLVFRTNSSYGRWYEGRRRFGRITTTCRDICRQVRNERHVAACI